MKAKLPAPKFSAKLRLSELVAYAHKVIELQQQVERTTTLTLAGMSLLLGLAIHYR